MRPFRPFSVGRGIVARRFSKVRLEQLEERRLMTATPWASVALADWPFADADEQLTIGSLAAEGEGGLVAVSLGVRNLDGSPLDSQQIAVGQAFQLIVSAQDLRTPPQGVFALFNDLSIAQSNNIEVLVGETQLLQLSTNVTGGSFQLGLSPESSVTIEIPAGFNATEQGSNRALATRIQNSLNAQAGPNTFSVVQDPRESNAPNYLINFRGEYLGSNAPALVANFEGLIAQFGHASGSITDDFYPADPDNADAFRFSMIDTIGGLVPNASYRTSQPNQIFSAGTARGLALPDRPGDVTPFYGLHFRALAQGNVSFTTSPGQQSPADDILLYPVVVASPAEVEFQSLTIAIGEGSNDPIVDLGTISGAFQLDGQAITTSGVDQLYRFTTTAAGQVGSHAAIEFTHSLGDLDIQLLDANQTPLVSSTGVGNAERVSLFERPAGTYYLRVYGYAGATNSFSLTINAADGLIAPDVLESNNSLTTATEVVTQNGLASYSQLTLHAADDQDYYRLTLSAVGGVQDRVYISFAHTSGDVDMVLRNVQGDVIASSTSSRDFEEISLQGLAAGTYFVHVYGFQGATSPRYAMRIQTPQPAIPSDAFEPNDSREQAAQLSVPNGRAHFSGLTIHSSSDQDWYRFTLDAPSTADHLVRLAFSHATADIDVELYNSAGVRLRSSAGVADFEEIKLVGLEAGDYFLRVYSFAAVPSPDYSLSLSLPVPSIAPDAWETNNALASAADLRVVSGVLELFDLSLHNREDEDWFRFQTVGTGTDAHFFGLFFSHALGDVDLALYDAQGQWLRQSTSVSDTELISLRELPAGVYYARVYGFAGATNPRYSLSFNAPDSQIAPDRFEPNDDSAQATQLRRIEGTRTLENLSLHRKFEADWFQFETAALSDSRHSVVVDFEHALGDIDIFLYTGNDEFISASTGVGNQEILSLSGLAAGSYKMLVSGFGETTNPRYSITFNTPTTATGNDRFEPNDSLEQATDLRVVAGQLTLSGLSIHGAVDTDLFRFETVAPGTSAHSVELSFRHALGDLDVHLFDSTGRIASSTSVTNRESLSLDGLPAGVYFVQVYGYAGATNSDYEITFHTPEPIQIDADRFEVNNTLATASLLRTWGDLLAGSLDVGDLSIHSTGDVDYYRFTTVGTATAAHAVAINYPAGGGALQLELLDSSGQVLSTAGTGSGAESLTLAGLSAGSYFIKVSAPAGGQNRYRLRVGAPTETTSGQLDAWTIMVYLTASDLAQFGFADINEMEQAVSNLPGSVNIAVLWDQSAAFPTYATDNGSQAAWGTLGRAFIQADTNPNRIATRFELLPEASTGDPATLTSFVQWAAANAPAERYALIGWDHGAGIYGSNFDTADRQESDYLEISEWFAALSAPDMPAIDLLSFDACLMAMAEIQFALRELTSVQVASQEVVSGDGYDYRTLFRALMEQPYAVTAEALATGFVQSYQNMTAGQGGTWDTQSAVRSSSLDALGNALLGFTQATVGLTSPQLQAIARAVEASISYADPEFRDLGSIMLGVMQADLLPTTVRQAAEQVRGAIDDALVSRANDVRRSSGVSVFAPASGDVGVWYHTNFAAFEQATGWGAMLARVGSLVSNRFSSGGRFGATASVRDWAESNDLAVEATNLFQLSGQDVVLPGLSLHDANDVDWYRFSILATGQVNHRIVAQTTESPLTLELYDASGTSLILSDQSANATVSLSGLAAGEYLLKVSSGVTAIRSYQLTTSAPEFTGRNRFGEHSTREKAAPLGIVGNHLTVPGMQLAGGATGWYTIDTPRLPEARWYSIQVNTSSTANIEVQVLDSSGAVVSRDSGTGQLVVGYRASGASETYSLRMVNLEETHATYNMAVNTLLGTLEDISVPERLLGVVIESLPLGELVQTVGQVTVDDPRFEWVDGALRLRDGQVLSIGQQQQVYVPITVSDAVQTEVSVSFVLPLTIDSNAFAFHNATSALNVNDDINPRTGAPAITALDALLIINELNTRGSRPLVNRNAAPGSIEPFLDTNRDGFVSPIDALLVINYLNNPTGGEGESTLATTAERAYLGGQVEVSRLRGPALELPGTTSIEVRHQVPGSAPLQPEWYGSPRTLRTAWLATPSPTSQRSVSSQLATDHLLADLDSLLETLLK